MAPVLVEEKPFLRKLQSVKENVNVKFNLEKCSSACAGRPTSRETLSCAKDSACNPGEVQLTIESTCLRLMEIPGSKIELIPKTIGNRKRACA